VNVLYLNHSEQVSGAEQSLRALLWEFRRSHSDIEPIVALPGAGPFVDMLRAEEWNVTFAPAASRSAPEQHSQRHDHADARAAYRALYRALVQKTRPI
jgi:hypothetical protein